MTPDIAALVERLRVQAENTSKAHRMMAEAKSLRQTDNPEGRSDLYRWLKPDETIEAQAADALTRLSAEVERARVALAAADDILEGYVIFLHHMPADELELHPYIPAVEETFDQVRAALAPASSEGEG